jgi:hypothetical protein
MYGPESDGRLGREPGLWKDKPVELLPVIDRPF